MLLRLKDWDIQASITGTNTIVPALDDLSVGDILIGHCAARDGLNSTSMSAPSGWTQLDVRNANSVLVSYIFYKVATASDLTATFNFPCETSGRERFAMVSAFTGVYESDPLGTDNGNIDETNSSVVTAISSDTFEHFVLLFGFNDAYASSFTTYSCATDDPTWTEVYDSGYNSGRTFRRFFAYGERRSTSNTGNITLNQESSQWTAVHSVIINSGNLPKVMFIS